MDRLGEPRAATDRQRVGGRQLLRTGEDRPRFRNVAQREIFLDRTRIDVAPQPAVGEQRLELGSEDERSIGEQRVIKRLHAQPVTGEEQRRAVAIPEREGEHSAKALDARFAPGLPCVHDDLGVAFRAERVAERGELGDQLLEVVDLSVVDDRDAAILVEQRLLAGGDRDDRQATMAKAYAGLDVVTHFVRPAVML